jgi:glycosyltransferase involved in cell wall biosynthesis
MKKILFLSPHYPIPYNSGSPIAIINTAKIFSSLNFQVDLLCLSNHDITTDLLDTGHTFFNNIFIIKKKRNIITAVLKACIFSKSMVYTRFYSKKFKQKFAKLANDYNYIYSHHNYMAQYLTTVNCNAIKLNDIHVLEYNFFFERANNTKNIFVKLLYKIESHRLKFDEIHTMQKNDFNFTYSELENEQMTSLNIKNILFRPLTLDYPDKLYSPTKAQYTKSITLLFFGDHKWYPNYDASKFIITVLSKVFYKVSPNIIIKIAGRNIPGNLKKEAELQNNIVILGEVVDIYEEIRDCDIILSPVRIGGGVRLKVLESLMLGKPVLTNSTGAEGIIDKTTMFICNNIIEYEEVLTQILQKPEILTNYSEKASSYFTKFHSTDAGKKYFQQHLNL